jgi:hypothetical protein
MGNLRRAAITNFHHGYLLCMGASFGFAGAAVEWMWENSMNGKGLLFLVAAV